jgi:hypothetical protein
VHSQRAVHAKRHQTLIGGKTLCAAIDLSAEYDGLNDAAIEICSTQQRRFECNV